MVLCKTTEKSRGPCIKDSHRLIVVFLLRGVREQDGALLEARVLNKALLEALDKISAGIVLLEHWYHKSTQI